MHTRSQSAFRLYFSVLFYVFALLALCRAAFWLFISPDMPAPLSTDAVKAFFIGLRFDARIAFLFTLPIGIILAIPPLAVRLHKAARAVAGVYLVLFFLLITVYAADFGFYAYLQQRVSRLMFELLEDIYEAFEMVMASYPVGLICAAVVTATLVIAWGLYRRIRKPVELSPSLPLRIGTFMFSLVAVTVIVLGQVNKSFVPLRWSNAYFTTDEAVIALGLNPVQNLYDTMGVSVQNFSREKAGAAYTRMADFFKVDTPDAATLSFLRHSPATTKGSAATSTGKTPNIVIIFMESLAFPKTSFAPGKGDPTPHLKALAEESLLFTRFFSNTRTTARAVFTTMTGIPDVSHGQTSSRNPLLGDQRLIAAEFKDYEKYYMIGGNLGWANIRGVIGQNIPGVRLMEEENWKSPHADVWGINDYDLLREAHATLASRSSDKPFLAVIQTASYHKPYTVPNTPGFVKDPASEEDLINYGFKTQEEYDSIRYVDFALGHFMSLAKSSSYYRDTVFFIFGDHGLTDRNTNMPAGYKAAHLAGWHTPMLIHASPELGLIQPRVSETYATQVDIFPTAAGLAGIAYDNRTMGRDLLDPRFDGTRVAFLSGNTNAPIRVLSGNYCYFDNRNGVRSLFDITGTAKNISQDNPELFTKLGQLATDLEATAQYILFNNRKR